MLRRATPPSRLGRAAPWLLVLAVVADARPARADEKIARLAERLTKAEDFRVRTQAALALGSSSSALAVEPLCKGLGDANATVRAAAAAGLGKLNRGGKECLVARLEEEPSKSVKGAIVKALARMEEGGGAEPVFKADSRYYVAIGKTADKSGRSGSVDGLVREAARKAAGETEGVVLAPAGETEAQAKARLAKAKVKGFYLTYKVNPPRYDASGLTVKVELSIFTYPGRSLKATLPLKLTQSGVTEEDTAAEDDLLRDATARAFGKFIAKAAEID